jgi:hypothetical protein
VVGLALQRSVHVFSGRLIAYFGTFHRFFQRIHGTPLECSIKQRKTINMSLLWSEEVGSFAIDSKALRHH